GGGSVGLGPPTPEPHHDPCPLCLRSGHTRLVSQCRLRARSGSRQLKGIECLTRASCRRSSLMLALGCSRERVGGSPSRCIQGCLELLPLYSASVCPRHSPPAMSGKAPGNSSSTAGITR